MVVFWLRNVIWKKVWNGELSAVKKQGASLGTAICGYILRQALHYASLINLIGALIGAKNIRTRVKINGDMFIFTDESIFSLVIF